MTHLEGTEKSKVNTGIDVLISTAGEGSRLHKINSQINKSLLPYLNKPIIYHIITKIPHKFKIGILVGYRSQQVKDFLSIAFPEREIVYIYVDDWESSKSGTKYSLSFARNLVKNSFWYFPCDGIYDNTNFLNESFVEDVFIVSKISQNKSRQYLTLKLENTRIVEQFFKLPESPGDYAFTGVMKIIDKDSFFDKLDESESNEFVSIISNKSLAFSTDNWKDLGNYESYIEEISKSEGFDFSKNNEFTYELSDKIIKWWPDPQIPDFKLCKPKHRPEVFPKNIQAKNQFLSYSKSPGSSYYESVNEINFANLLDWLQLKLWSFTNDNIENQLLDFYKNKTLSRIELLGDKKNHLSFNPKKINGVSVKPWQEYLDNINWDLLIKVNKPSFIHGDLQFDNIIFDVNSNKFILIDWRYDFSGLKLIGDLYYDIAKMMGGIYVNYFKIKKGEFKFQSHDDNITFELPLVNQSKELIFILESYQEKLGINLNKVRELVPIIFWNMAPLHKEPFSNLCWILGIFHFEMMNNPL